MDIQTISLPTGAALTAYLHPRSAEMQNPYTASRAALILCPGGGYSMRSDRENVPPAMLFFNMGFQVFVLSYSVGAAAANRRPLEELGRSVQLVRANREAWNIDPNRVAVLGFSAGGHLAASLGVHWNDPVTLQRPRRPRTSPRCTDLSLSCHHRRRFYPRGNAAKYLRSPSGASPLLGPGDPRHRRHAARLPLAHHGRRLRPGGKFHPVFAGAAPCRCPLRVPPLYARAARPFRLYRRGRLRTVRREILDCAVPNLDRKIWGDLGGY